MTPWGTNTHWIIKVQLKERLENLLLPFACCLQVTAPSTLGFTSPWAGGHTDATVTTGTDTERGPRRGTLQLMMEENPPHTVSPNTTKRTMSCHFMGFFFQICWVCFAIIHFPPFVSFAAADTPAQRVQFLLGTEDGDEEHIPHALFTELDEICLREGEDAEWKETARYTASHMGWVWASVTPVCLTVLQGCVSLEHQFSIKMIRVK